jgi:hypothetical protein
LILSTGAWQLPDGGTGALMRLPLDGGTPSTILEGLDGPTRVFVAGPAIYWTESGPGNVRRAVPGGVIGEFLAQGRDHPRDIGVDAGTVYWLEKGSGGPATVFMLPPDGGVPQALSTPRDSPSNLVLNFAGVYWSDDSTGYFSGRRWLDFAPDGFSYEAMPPFEGPWHVTSAVDGLGAYVFWADSARHAIRTRGYPCPDLVSGEANPDWVATGFDSHRTGDLSAGFHVFWVEGARIRRLTTTNTHAGGTWCQ